MEVNKEFTDRGYQVELFLVHGPRTWRIKLDKPTNFNRNRVVNIIENLGYSVTEINLLSNQSVNIIFKSGQSQPFYNLLQVQKIRK